MNKHSYYAAIITLYDQNFQVDEAKMRSYIQFLLDRGIRGFFPCGTSGGCADHSVDENLKILRLVVDVNQGQCPILPCVSNSNVQASIRMIHEIEKIGLSAVSICPPYYTALRPSDIYDYYKKILAATNLDIYLYNIPAFTHALPYEVFQKLLCEPRIKGIKDSSGNLKSISRYITDKKQKNPDFSVMTGTDEIILPTLVIGGFGSVTALSGIIPEIHNKLYDTFENNLSLAKEIQNRIVDLAMSCEKLVFPVGYKLALEARGFQIEPYLQNVWESESEITKIRKEIKVKVDSLLRDFGTC